MLSHAVMVNELYFNHVTSLVTWLVSLEGKMSGRGTITPRLEAIALRLEAIAIRLEAIASRFIK